MPRDGRRFYDSVVRKQDDIRPERTRDLQPQADRKRRNAAHWVHAKFTGSVDLARMENLVTAKIKSRNKADESKLCTAFLGWVDRHFGDDLASVTIQYRYDHRRSWREPEAGARGIERRCARAAAPGGC